MKETRVLAILLGILSFIAIGVVLKELSSVLVPFAIALFIFYLFKPLVVFLVQRRVPTGLAILIVLCIVGGLLFGLSMIVGSSIKSFAAEAPKYAAKIEYFLQGVLNSINENDFLREYTQDQEWGDLVSIGSITTIFTSGLGSFASTVGDGVLILLYLVFLLAGTGQFIGKLKIAFSSHHASRLAQMAQNIDNQVREYIVTKILISLGTGALSSIILYAFGVDFALLWGFLTFILNFVPNVGSVIATLFPILLSLLQFDTPVNAAIIAALLIGTQLVMGNVVEPKLMESRLNLSPVLILVSLILWSWLWGIWGAILAVPIMSTIKIVLENIEVLRPIAVLMTGDSNAIREANPINEA